MGKYAETGEIEIPLNRLNRSEILLFLKSLKHDKINQIDFYYRDGIIYITASSASTFVYMLLKIPLNKWEKKQAAIEEVDDLDFLGLDIEEFETQKEDSSVKGKDLAFSTETEFLDALLIESKEISSVKVIVDEEKVTVESLIYTLPFPKIRFSYDLDFYLSIMQDRAWEEINVHNVNAVADAVSNLRVSDVDMYIAIEKDNVYSDNPDAIISAKTMQVKGSYYFGYEAIFAFRGIAKSVDTAQIAFGDGMTFLNYSNVFFAWSYARGDVDSQNIMEYFDIDKMDTLFILDENTIKKLRVFNSMITEKDKDNVVQMLGVDEGVVLVTSGNKSLRCACQCFKGAKLEIDLNSLLQAAKLVGTNAPKIKANLYTKDVTNALISGNLNIVIGIVKVEKTQNN